MDYFKITTDETLRETVQHGSERYPFAYYPEDIWQFDFHRIDWHWHHELEFLYVAEGTAICFIGTSKVELHKGCGIFINSGCYTVLKHDPAHLRLILFFHLLCWHPKTASFMKNIFCR